MIEVTSPSVLFEGPENDLLLAASESGSEYGDGNTPPPVASPINDEHEDETEWRILCAVHAFQRRPRYAAWFVARDEGIMSVLERAHIVLLPPGGSLKLVLVDPLPCHRMLTFIISPAWWSEASIHPFFLWWSEDNLPPFVEIARPGSVLADFLVL